MYSIYNSEDLTKKLNSVTEYNDEIINFFNNFSFNTVVNQNLAKGNSTYVFKNAIKEDTTKSKIVQLLNKLHQQNLSKITTMIREIIFQTQDEVNELISQCITKIKRDNDQIRPLVATLCFELLSTYFETLNHEKIYFRKLLLKEVKLDYLRSIDYDNEEWTRDAAEKTMILVSTLYNSNIIETNIMASIINDFIKKIEYKENGQQEDYEKVEKSVQLLSYLISSVIMNEESIKLFLNIDKYLEDQMVIYEEKKCISKKIRLICKNTIGELRKSIK